ncbi:binding--dependent transport system inner membrane component family protein, partial [Vibrio cholerae HC-57A2]
MHEPSQALK